MLIAIVLIIAAGLCALAALTRVGVSLIERAYPPAGRLVDVEGGRLHVVELGPKGQGPAVVLLHGASGNLEDMRLALGEKLAVSRRVILIDRPGHGWSARLGGEADASPRRQALLVASLLHRMGVARPIIVAHSWSGALASAYALAYPDQISGLVLISAVTHPWPGAIAWYYRLSATPVVGPLFANCLVLPLGFILLKRAVAAVFSPQRPPDNYVSRAAIALVLRPAQFLSNARDVAGLKDAVTAQAPHYGEIQTPSVIITGDRDKTVSPRLHSRAMAKALPHAKLIVLQGTGHMPHHSASDVVIRAIEQLLERS
jgi:pimeloyl-ACP methyl ester carboxylesterase